MLDYFKKTFKGKCIAVAVIAVMAIAVLPSSMLLVSAKDVDTYLDIAVSPNPVGVGQNVYAFAWLSVYPPTAAGAGGDRWKELSITIWKPDGTTEKREHLTSDPVGGVYIMYTPTQEGKYSFQASFPGQTLQAGDNPSPAGMPYVGYNFKASTSKKVDLTVQSTQVPQWQAAEMPTGYWDRPISADLREWNTISGNWLFGRSNYAPASRMYNPYSEAPRTSHVVWTKEYAYGGLIGGDMGDQGYYSGITYENKFTPPIIMNGRLFYNVYPATPPSSGFICVNLRTGETEYIQNATGPSTISLSLSGYGQNELRMAEGYPKLTYGQIFNPDTPNQHGGIPYIWTTGGSGPTARWDCYDAVTGAWLYSMKNVSASTFTIGPKGELLGYMLGPMGKWLAMWNSSNVKGLWGGTQGTEAWQWRPPINEILDGNTGLEWNKTTAGVQGPGGLGIQVIDPDSDVIVAVGAEAPFIGFGDKTWMVGYDGKTGQQLWTKEWPIPFGATLMGPAYGANIVAGEGVFGVYEKETMKWHIFDLNTGERKVTTEPRPGSDWGLYSEGGNIAYGKLFSAGYDGRLCAWDLNTGKLLWSYSSGNSGEETVYGTWPLVTGPIANGVIYTYTNEHSPNSPFYRGAKLHAVDVNSGQELWSLTGWWGHNHYTMNGLAIADGYLIAPNMYDGQVYAFGKGQTSVTVTASPKVATKSSGVLIEGTIMDQSPGAKGTPAIADQYMNSWMEYLYQQKPKPTDATGVPVSLTAVDANGKSYDIGTATSDTDGKFSTMWTPPAEGKYTIVANFDGTDSYFASHDSTALGVGTTSDGTNTSTTSVAGADSTLYIGIAVIALIVAIIAVVLALRRR